MKMSAYHRTLEYHHLVSKRRTKSLVWAHFGLPADSCGEIITDSISICKHCTTAVSTKGGSTSNMFSHLKLYHPLHYKDMSATGNQSLPVPINTVNEVNTENAGSSFVIPVFKQTNELLLENPVHKKQKIVHDFLPSSTSEDCTLSISKFLATTMQPYSIVENSAFVEMLFILNPTYELPSKNYFSENGIPKLYNDTVEKIRQCLVTVENNSEISLTADHWISKEGIPYIAISCHFIDNEWELKSFCLTCTHLEEDRISDDIADVLANLSVDWGLDIKDLASCTTDNSANMLKAIHSLNLSHIPCLGHIINFAVNRALELPELKSSVTRLHKLQNALAHTCKVKQDIGEAQELLKMEGMIFSGTCETRWWSTLKLCCKFLDNQLLLCEMFEGHPAKEYLPEGSEISALEDFVGATKVLKDIITTLSGEEYLTASSVLPLYRKIKRTLQIKEEDSDLMHKIKSELLYPLSEIYEKDPLVSILRMASLCDPRFRLNFTDSADESKETAILYLNDLYLFDELTTSQTTLPIVTTKKSLSDLLEDEDETSEEVVKPRIKAEIELNNYLMMPKVSLETNPLTWWKSNESNFPRLKTLAKKFLAMQGTCVPSEQVFDSASNIISNHRISLLQRNAEMQIFLAQNKNII